MKIKNQQEIATPYNCRKTPTRIVVYIATMVAISIVLKLLSNTLSQTLPSFLKISLAYLGWYIAAAILGPWAGGAVAVISDLIGQWLIPTGGAPNLLLMAGNGLNAIIFGLTFKYVKFNKLPPYADMLIRTVLGAVFSAIICTLGVNTFGLWYFYYPNTNYWAFTVSRLTQLTSVAANIILFAATIPVLSNMGLLPPLKRKSAGEENDVEKDIRTENDANAHSDKDAQGK